MNHDEQSRYWEPQGLIEGTETVVLTVVMWKEQSEEGKEDEDDHKDEDEAALGA